MLCCFVSTFFSPSISFLCWLFFCFFIFLHCLSVLTRILPHFLICSLQIWRQSPFSAGINWGGLPKLHHFKADQEIHRWQYKVWVGPIRAISLHRRNRRTLFQWPETVRRRGACSTLFGKWAVDSFRSGSWTVQGWWFESWVHGLCSGNDGCFIWNCLGLREYEWIYGSWPMKSWRRFHIKYMVLYCVTFMFVWLVGKFGFGYTICTDEFEKWKWGRLWFRSVGPNLFTFLWDPKMSIF